MTELTVGGAADIYTELSTWMGQFLQTTMAQLTVLLLTLRRHVCA